MNARPRLHLPDLRLVSRASGLTHWRPGVRLALASSAMGVVVGMALIVSAIAANELRQTATDSALRNIEAIVRGYVDPTIHEDSMMLGGTPDRDISAQLGRITVSGDIRRINIWSRDGRVVYSNEPSLEGHRFSIDGSLATAFSGESVTEYVPGSEAGHATGPFVTSPYLEIYVPIRGAVDGNPLGVYEVYQDARPIEVRVARTQKDVFLVAVVASLVLLALLWLGYAASSRLLARQNRQLRDRAVTEQALMADMRRSEERFRSLVRNASDCIVIARADGTVTYESPAVERVLGYARDNRLDRPAFEDVHPDDIAWVARLFGDVGATPDAQASATIRVRHRDGSWRSLEVVSKNMVDDAAVRGIVVNYRDVTERQTLEDQLRHQAFHDALTGLPNRALFLDRLEHARSRIRDGQSPLAVVFLDLDDFKAVNDNLGHAGGDELLVQVASRIRNSLRDGDTAARMGGDEFAILLEDAPNTVGPDAAQRLVEALRRPFTVGSQPLLVRASAGLALFTSARETADELIRNADVAMYIAKQQGKDRLITFSSKVHDATLERLQLRADLTVALDHGEFTIDYQPVIELATGEIRGVEALVRWQHPRRGLLGPNEFIPLAEENGEILVIGRWVLQQACVQAQTWSRFAPDVGLSMAVNLSGRQIDDPHLVADVAAALSVSGLPAHLLTLEITESVLMADVDATTTTLRALKDLGVRLAIDDFGTGYSSLSYLRRFPVDILKIDRSFVATLHTGDTDTALVRSILSLGQTLELETIAEGIEEVAQLAQLQNLGASLGQGFLFARPMGPVALTALLEQRMQEPFWQPLRGVTRPAASATVGLKVRGTLDRKSAPGKTDRLAGAER